MRVTKRVTIADIAEKAGLSKGAVSYALNGQPGVSESTRQRVLRMALELGWHPNSAAKALSGARSGAFGLVMARSPETLGIEPFFMKLISGMEAAMAASQTALLLQVVADHDTEIATYRRWWAERRVDGVILIDLRRDDRRVAVLEELRLPAIVVGGPGHHGGLPGVWIDDAGVMVVVIEYLAALRHRRIARVAGVAGMLHTELRTQAFDEVSARLGLESTTVTTDYTPDQGAQVTRRLLSSANPPTAIVYDNDVMAVAGVSVAHEMGVDVPGELSIMAWDDSVLCEIVHPPLTAVDRDITAYGRHVAEHLLALLDGQQVTDFESQPPRLVVRGSTARPVNP
ncbi:LacI family DNA-binding transcriptional regulator [Actinophytocola gossypii]|uniref:LacI family DNA-binding transcriptional regulator n=1 Tax=Actinophytocola gossypii TaxID=2812003 RepID=A0ABT2JDG0_9PSEU|nr:LacI family DNA-binding transcriptional regulator [Actinophytocola gossypii]MCT2585475.1 LacI family DNA-binding transcriptional regulator [Actinophytocola gossypii]